VVGAGAEVASEAASEVEGAVDIEGAEVVVDGGVGLEWTPESTSSFRG
jgi:hypothetical protein